MFLLLKQKEQGIRRFFFFRVYAKFINYIMKFIEFIIQCLFICIKKYVMAKAIKFLLLLVFIKYHFVIKQKKMSHYYKI